MAGVEIVDGPRSCWLPFYTVSRKVSGIWTMIDDKYLFRVAHWSDVAVDPSSGPEYRLMRFSYAFRRWFLISIDGRGVGGDTQMEAIESVTDEIIDRCYRVIANG